MPEMPEVITVVKDLKPKVINKKIKKIIIIKPKLIKETTEKEFNNFLIDETIKNIFNLGKHIIFQLSNDKYLLSHLRMTGKYFTHKYLRKPTMHDCLVFEFEDNTALYYNDSRQFGTFYIKNKQDLYTTKPLDKLGKIPGEIDIDEFYKKIKNRRIVIKTLLLDQSLVLGIGNIYANEALFAAKIHPNTPTNQLSKEEISLALKHAQSIMDHSTKLGGSSIDSYTSVDGVKGGFQKLLKVHLRNNKPCLVCSTPINKIWINGRGTYYCPNCQKLKEVTNAKKI
ncbi:bifunctional DNA-formamidopyrimidine glycosylase/DNA-(apurinic or apyrimidinic site) lyase [Mycoplasmopsis lipofaciens]|uniref:bifunctional DNA-formamidopyrimidine glycosylase/DNA-(apurinic or apyrimidinic site) lyase n=1 Tax=Mycoplasmopsis lipofaciens TaxID=114884 RepID=UPI0004830A3B|nr:bifunctional DNA-formamidopyrimidine glycosylase/DNA-(apurinic or apyrimidinic site) lyase [Mycoplasmopsis lipofaciens]